VSRHLRHLGSAACGCVLLAASPVAFSDEPDTSGESYALDRMEMRAQLSPQRFTTLSAELAAKIKRISVKEGERFKAGQQLVEFDCSLQAAQLSKARAQLAATRNTWRGNKRLAELNAIGQVELSNSEAEMMKARADVQFLDVTLQKCSLNAPYDGRLAEQKAREQQYVQAGQPLLEILDDSALELEFIAPSRWLAWLKPGHAFEVLIEDTETTYPARLLRVAAKADPVSQSIKAVGVIDGQYPELIAGMSGRILIEPKTQN